ncbi:MAG: peptidase, partial [Burkholderiales bacterium]|nr:peptidase [Burkholderiales bacterium]
MKSLHVFKKGRQTATSGVTITFTEADLKASAEAYDPALHEAPIVIGHPKTDDPAYGWIKS